LVVDRVGRLRDHLSRIWRHVGIGVEDTQLSYLEHEQILAAMRTGDAAKLQSAVERHISAVGLRVASRVTEPELENATLSGYGSAQR
jgi:DNA-binding FadR family transcriptional regulator